MSSIIISNLDCGLFSFSASAEASSTSFPMSSGCFKVQLWPSEKEVSVNNRSRLRMTWF
jgi:hypothetical protein